uniref:Uncharacterized protein n=1 Tax=Timema poppense TaxID=170557 RepID=A0A7R9HBY0_TIMPO|nr:unnamed protein product [Timema poppensis]
MLSPVMSQQAAGSWLLTRLATTLNNMLKSTLSVCNSDNHDHKHLCGLLFSPPKTVTARGYGYGGPSLYGHGGCSRIQTPYFDKLFCNYGGSEGVAVLTDV